MYDNSGKFKELYVEFENLVMKKYPPQYGEKNRTVSDIVSEKRAERISPYYENYDFLDFCRRYRNKISHEENEFKYLDFSDALIDKLEDIIYKIKNPYDVYSKSIKAVYSASLGDNVRDVMKEMMDKNFTHIPVYSDDKKEELCGVFSESIIFKFLSKESSIDINDETTFNDIKELIKVENSKDIVKFFPKEKLYDEVVNYFVSLYNKGEKLNCIMVTKSGKETEKVEGILTTWDIIRDK